MATPSFQIEVIDIDANRVTAAFYYEVPVGSQLSGAVDPTRTQFGRRLSAGDVTALQQGTIYGELITRTISGLTPEVAAALLQSEYTAYTATALANYASLYTNKQYAGAAFDGSVWS